MYRTYRINVVHDEAGMEYLQLPAFRGPDIEHLKELFPHAAIWSTANEFGSQFDISTAHARELYARLRGYADRQVPSDEPYVVGYTFGSIPTMSSLLAVFNTLIPYLEGILEIEDKKGYIKLSKFVQRPLA